MSEPKLQAPFPYFGGKSRIADRVWERFGVVRNYVEPFFGSGATLLRRPQPFDGVETVNDADGMVANFWRAVQADPEAVAHRADWPVNENDLHARHIWLVGQKDSLQAKLEGDDSFFDAKIAGWWCWGMCCWIGSGFCSGTGPWRVVDGELVNGDAGQGVNRKRVHLSNAGRGVKRQRVQLGDAGRGVKRQRVHLGSAGQGVNRKRVHLSNAGRGVKRQRVHLGSAGQGVNRKREESGIYAWMRELAERLRFVRVCCGDWSRVTGKTVVRKYGASPTALFLDPPYADTATRCKDIYAVDSQNVAHDVREWAIANGDNPKLRIALCGYEGEHAMPESWECLAWKTQGGYGSHGSGNGRANATRERIWFSPYCVRAKDVSGMVAEAVA